MKKFLVIVWLTVLCFLLLGNVHAWDVPAFLRLNAGSRTWFSALQGDLIQGDRTKVDLMTMSELIATSLYGNSSPISD